MTSFEIPNMERLMGFEGIKISLHTCDPTGGDVVLSDAYARSDADVTWPTATFGEFFYGSIWSDTTGGRKMGEWTPLTGWVFYRLPQPRPWKVHQSRFRQRRRR